MENIDTRVRRSLELGRYLLLTSRLVATEKLKRRAAKADTRHSLPENKIRRFLSSTCLPLFQGEEIARKYRENIYIIFLLAQSLLESVGLLAAYCLFCWSPNCHLLFWRCLLRCTTSLSNDYVHAFE